MAPVPPPLPPARVVPLPGRGEVFVRTTTDPDSEVPVVLLHGWMATADLNWFPTYAALAGRRPLVALDQRGHGRGLLTTEPVTLEGCADDVVALLDELRIDRALLAGYSLGTAVAQLVAARHPERVAGMVLCAGALRWNSPSQRFHMWRGGWEGALQRVSAGRWFARKLADRAARTSPAAATHREWLTAEFERGHPGLLRTAGHALARFDGRPLLAVTERIPTTVVLTEGDHLLPVRRQHELAEALGAREVPIEGDHDAAVALGEVFAPLLADELDRLAPPVTTPSARRAAGA